MTLWNCWMIERWPVIPNLVKMDKWSYIIRKQLIQFQIWKTGYKKGQI